MPVCCIFFLLPLFYLSGCSQPSKSDEKKIQDRLARNKIQRISEYKTSFNFNEAGKEHLSHVKVFNDKGYLLKEIDCNESGLADRVLIYEYDKNGKLIGTTTKNPDSTLLGKEIRAYDEKNNIIKLIHLLSDGSTEYKYVYRSDADGRIKEMEVYWPSELSAVFKYTYEGKKKLEEAEYSSDNKLISRKTYAYDAHGDLLEEKQSDLVHGKTFSTKYIYNLIHQLTSQTLYSDDAIQKTTSFEYDKKYLLSKKTEFSSAGKITAKYRYEYEFFE